MEPQPLARRSFFRVSAVKFHWNSQGTAVVVLATSDVDKTNQNYYGESSLHFLKADGSMAEGVPLSKDGPVHDICWSPRGTEFVAVYGFMPSKATLFSDTLKPLFEFSAGPYNVVRWNPFGRFLVRAGFGNLPGDVDILDRKADAKCKQIVEVRMANSVSIDWSPCGRYLLTATTAPRLQVDNGFTITKYTGARVFHHGCVNPSQLFQLEWQPASADAHEDRPQTPGAAAAAKAAPQSGIAAKPAPYRPPGAAARSETTPLFSLAREAGGAVGGKPAAFKPSAARQGPPGSEFVEASKTASKNAKKRAAAKAKKDGE